MEKFFNFAFSTILLILCLKGALSQTCEPQFYTPVQNFNVDKILGNWTLWKSYTALAEDATPADFRCLVSSIEYFGSDNFPLFISSRYVNTTDGTAGERPSIVKLSEESEAVWEVVGISDDGAHLRVIGTVYVQTDYENWALQYGCIDGHSDMRIWTRTRRPDLEVIQLLEILVRNYGFPLENEVPIDQTNCE